MKKKKKYLSRSSLIAFILVFAIIGCKDNSTSEISTDNNKISTKKISFTGAQYYRGIILGLGPVAKEIPYVKDNNLLDKYINDEKGSKLISNLSSKVIDKIRENNPDYFNSFKQIMESGQPIKIKNAIQSAFKLKDKVAPTILDIPAHKKAFEIISNHPQEVKRSVHSLFKEDDFSKKYDLSEEKVMSKLAKETGLKTYTSQLKKEDYNTISEKDLRQETFHFKAEIEVGVVAVEIVALVTVVGEKEPQLMSSQMAINEVSKSIATDFNKENNSSS